MAKAVRFTKDEREEVRLGLEWRSKLTVNRPGRGPEPTPRVKHALSALQKLEMSEVLRAKESGGALPVKEALDALREVLGTRLTTPPNPGKVWWLQMSGYLKRGNYSRTDVTTAAKVAADKWKGLIKAESVLRNAEILIAEAQLDLPHTRDEERFVNEL